MRSHRIAAALLAGTLALVACDIEDPEGEGANIVDTTAGDTATDEPTGTSGEQTDEGEEPSVGTRDNPVQVGTTIDLGDWQVAVTDVTTDATDALLAENEFNEPPADGRQFVMWDVEATYTGEDSGTAWLDLSWAVVGSAGNTFGTSMDDDCGLIPSPLSDTGETFPDGSVSGNVCVSVPSDQIDGGTIRLENTLSLDTNRVFFAIP